jgi:serine/threonine-protein kinase
VIHRDIKPANILLSSGRPLVADFGIAFAVSSAGAGRLTETGLSMGTPYYMSPEQASADREPTPATDLYSLGCVLYEMLVGEPPFIASTAQGVLAKILSSRFTRPMTVRDAVPDNVDAAVARALERIPADRFDDAEAFRAALADSGFRHGAEGPKAVAEGGGDSRLLAALGALVVLFAGLSGWALFGRSSIQADPVSRYVISIPGGLRSDSEGGSSVTVSPDGTQIVYVGTASTGQARQLYVRRRDRLMPTPLPGTEDALSPVFSPDGQRVAFITPSQGTLKVIALDGEGAVSWAGPLGESRGIAWGHEGEIYIGGREGLRRVPAGGGEPELITTVDVANNERRHIYPSILPNGAGVVFQVLYTPSEEVGNHEIWVLDFAAGERRRLDSGLGPRYIPSGHLAFVSTDGILLVQPFDVDRMQLTGAPIPIAEGVGVGPYGVVDMAVSEHGDLMYRTGTAGGGELVFVARDGTATSLDPDWREDFRTLAISPDGMRLAVEVGGVPSTDIWLKPMAGGTPVKFTLEGAWNARPRWSPGGDTIAFISRRAGNADVWVRPTNQSALAEMVVDLERGIFEPAWTPDGQALVVRTVSNSRGSGDILMYRRGAEDEVVELIGGEAQQWGPVVSPNGRWLAYSSDETGQFEVYVVPFPNTGGSTRAISSPDGGREVMWAHSGEELFYRSGAGDMMAVEVETEGNFTHGARRRLFSTTGYRTVGGHQGYVVTRDDRGFVMIRMAGSGDVAELVVVENWLTEIEAMAGIR